MAIWVRMSFLVNRRMQPDFRLRFSRFFKTFVFDFFQMEYKAAIEGVILGLVTTLIFFGTMMLEHDFDEGNDIKFSSHILKLNMLFTRIRADKWKTTGVGCSTSRSPS